MQRVSRGQRRKPFTASERNEIASAVDFANSQMLRGRPGSGLMSIRTDILKVKNSNAFNVQQGKVLEVSLTPLVDEMRRGEVILDGIVPTPNYKKLWVVAMHEVPAGEIGYFQASGIALVDLDIDHALHRYVTPIASSTRLHSNWYGEARIITTETSALGFQWAFIQMGNPFYGPIDVKPGGNAVSGGSATCTVWLEGLTTSDTIVVENIWGDLGTINANTEQVAFFKRDQQKYVFKPDFQ